MYSHVFTQARPVCCLFVTTYEAFHVACPQSVSHSEYGGCVSSMEQWRVLFCVCMPDVTVARHSTSFPFLVCSCAHVMMSIAECVPFTPGMCPCMPATVARHSTSFQFLVCTHNNINFPLLSKECLLFPYEWYLMRLSYSVCSFPVMSFDVW